MQKISSNTNYCKIRSHIILILILIIITFPKLNASLLYNETNDKAKVKNNTSLPQLIFGDYIYKNSYSLVFATKSCTFAGSSLFLGSGKLLWTINNEITIGVTASTLIGGNLMIIKDTSNQTISGKINYDYGGFLIGYTPNFDENFCFSVFTNQGVGQFNMNYRRRGLPFRSRPTGYLYYIEPGFNLEFKYNTYIKLGIETSYNISKEFKINPVYENDPQIYTMNSKGINTGIYLKVGIF